MRIDRGRTLWLELITNAPHRSEMAWPRRIGLDFFTQAADMYRHSAILTIVIIVPDVFQQLLASKDLPGMRGEKVEQIVFLGCQADGATTSLDLARVRVDGDVAIMEIAIKDHRWDVERAQTAHDRLDAGNQLARVERLGEVVIGARMEAFQFLDILRTRREHQN